jgi:predicted outer membrane protein
MNQASTYKLLASLSLVSAIFANVGIAGASESGNSAATSREEVPKRDRGPNIAENVDQELIADLIRANQAEVTIGSTAEGRALSDSVKSFAKEMQKDHSAIVNKLVQLQSSMTATRPTRVENRTTTTDLTLATKQPAGAQAEGRTLFRIKAEIDKRTLATQQRELAELPPNQFDRAYIGMQVGTHTKMADILAVYKTFAEAPELKTLIDQGAEVTDNHLQHAKRIMKGLEER